MTEYKNIDLVIKYEAGQAKKRKDIAMGFLLGLVFLITSLRMLMGTWSLPSSFGEFLNLVLRHITAVYPLVHDYFTEPEGNSLVFVLITIMALFGFMAAIWAAVRFRLWPVFIALLLAVTALQTVFYDSPWYLAATFYLIWVVTVFWLLSQKKGNLMRLAVSVCVILVLAAGGSYLAKGTSLTSPWDRLWQNEHAVTALPQGDFSNLQEFKLSKDTAFTITMSEPESYYLKGFSGEVYTGTGWTLIDNRKLSDYNDIFYWLHEKAFYGYGQITAATGALEKKEKCKMTIDFSPGETRYLLLPYETENKPAELLPVIGDNRFQCGSGKVKQYSLSVTKNKVKNANSYKQRIHESENSKRLREYLLSESSYRDFTYDCFTKLNYDVEKLLEEVLGTKKELSAAQVKAVVLKVLSSFEYDENTTYRQAEGDFFEVFITEKCGYSVHFATAAALMFRYYGIPARYVEGYLITPDDIKDAKAGQPLKIDQSHAHAWMEYYEDGLGFIPFEATGPYIGVMGSDDNLSYTGSDGDDQKNKREKQKKTKEKKTIIPEVELSEHALFIVIGLLCMLLLFILIIVVLLRKKFRLRKGTHIKDNKKAVQTMTRYILKRLSKEGLTRKNIPLTAYETEVTSVAGKEIAAQFVDVAKIYEEVVYSRKTVTKEQRDCVTQLALCINKKIRLYKRGEKHERKKKDS